MSAARSIQQSPMTAEEARSCVSAIRERVEGIRALVLDLYERRGWVALGYKSWRECVVAEFDQSQGHLYRQLQAALIEREISPRGEIGQVPEKHLRPLSVLSPSERKEAFDEAKEATGGKVTSRAVKEAVQKRQPPRPRPALAPKPAAYTAPGTGAAEPGRTRVNGVEQDDPPEIAALRKAGKIPPGEIPDITESAEPELEPEPELATVEQTEQEWLESLSLHHKLSGRCRDIFDADALSWRRLKQARDILKHHAGRNLVPLSRNRGAYGYRVRGFLSVDSPDKWYLCPTPENGGCGGTGTVEILGHDCQECYGRGYRINN